MTKTLPLLLLLLLAGCQATPLMVWERPAMTPADLERDVFVCDDLASLRWGGTMGAWPFGDARLLSRGRFADCMKAHGYTGRPPRAGEMPQPD